MKNKYEVVQSWHYIGEACDCCEGDWYEHWLLCVNGEPVKYKVDDFGNNGEVMIFRTEELAYKKICELEGLDVTEISEGYPE